MQTNKANNVIFLKNTESNIIEEAFLILKENVKINDFKDNKENKKIDVLKEAESLINEKIKESNLKFEKFKIEKLEKKIKILKISNIIFVIAVIISIILN